MSRVDKRSVLGGSLLVAGTAIGAGMLALPIASASGGFLPTTIVYLLCWMFSLCTGLLIFEALLQLPHEANIISLANHYLGRGGRFAAWVLYLFLFYCLTIAYVTAGGSVFQALLPNASPYFLGSILFTTLFGMIVFLGPKSVGRINVLLMAGLITSYCLFVVIGFDQVKLSRLSSTNTIAALGALPIVFTSFSYQGLVPSLSTYLKRDSKSVRLAIMIGSSIPFITYVLWDFLIKGIIPVEGAHGLLEAKKLGLPAVEPLKYFLNNSIVYVIGQFFAFFAVTTSFFGVTLPLVDFLADGLKVSKKGLSRLGLIALVYIPSLAISITNPTIFFKALNFAGGIGCVFLLGLMPILMVWVGRYRLKDKIQQVQLPGGKWLLIVLLLFIAFELFFTIKAIV